MTWGWT